MIYVDTDHPAGYGRIYPIRFVTMARLNDDKDDVGNLQYTFYLSCNHFIKLPENLAFKTGIRNTPSGTLQDRIRSVLRCYRCDPVDDS